MKKPQFHALEDDICDIAEILNKPESLSHNAVPFLFVISIQN